MTKPSGSDSADHPCAVTLGLRQGLEDLAVPAGPVLVAVSGGPDSVALLLAWHKLAKQFDHQLTVAHFDHQLRPDSGDDADFVQDLAESLGLPCYHGLATPLRSGSEASARAARYAFLVRTAQQLNITTIATAHTADDHVETVLMAILRGTGFSGLAGIPKRRLLAADVGVVRPLLAVSRKHIEEYLGHCQQDARVDSTNTDTRFMRNWLRAELLPLLRQRVNPRLDDAIRRLSSIAEETATMVTQLATGLLESAVIEQTATSVVLDRQQLASAQSPLSAELFRLIWMAQDWPRQAMGHQEYCRLRDLACGDGPRRIDLPGGVTALRRQRPTPRLVLIRQAVDEEAEIS